MDESVEANLFRLGVWVPGMDMEPIEPDSQLFVCPVCRNQVRQREPMGPLCTGPSWTDDHEPTMMKAAA